jgi:hypothetical protein
MSRLTGKSDGDAAEAAANTEEEYKGEGDDNEIPGDLSMPGMHVSTLAMMDERKPEAWLGNFLAIIGAPPAINYSTIASAREDSQLKAHMQSIWEQTMEKPPARMLDPLYADALKARDWAEWWRGQERLGRYAYSVLALALLGDRTHNSELVDLYRQESNSRIRKDAHYTICYLLGKPWPAYRPTEADLARLMTTASPPDAQSDQVVPQ